MSNSFVVSTGDSIGASTLASVLFHDEPTIEFLNSVGVTASVVGNHEFDEGYDELERMQQGGCHPTDGCQFSPTFAGAESPFLGANVTLTDGTPALLPVKVQMSGGPHRDHRGHARGPAVGGHGQRRQRSEVRRRGQGHRPDGQPARPLGCARPDRPAAPG